MKGHTFRCLGLCSLSTLFDLHLKYGSGEKIRFAKNTRAVRMLSFYVIGLFIWLKSSCKLLHLPLILLLPVRFTMALPMKKSVMKTMKSMKTKAGTKVMKKKAVSKIARGKLAKVVVFKGRKEKTASGHSRSDLMKNKRNKVVSKKQNAAGKKAYANISTWTNSVIKARKELGIKGFCAVNGKSSQGKALYAKAKAIYADA